MRNSPWRTVTLALGVTAGSLLLATVSHAAWELDVPVGVTTLSDTIRNLHHLILGICTVIGAGVFGTLIYALFRFRRSGGSKAASFSHSTYAEVIWTTIPVLVLIYMAIPSARAIIQIEDASNPDLTIKVTGYQWKWGYDYLDEGISFISSLAAEDNLASLLGADQDPFEIDNYLRNVDRPLVVPVDRKVRLLLTADDVIHAWWVPELYVKKDANPGFINESWFIATETGTFRGQCAELCGRGHGFMPIVVEVVSEKGYRAWVAAQKAPAEVQSTSAL